MRGQMFTQRSFPVVVAIAAALAVAGCGRKGPLEPPPNAPQAEPAIEGEAVREGPRPVNPDRPFILDGLL